MSGIQGWYMTRLIFLSSIVLAAGCAAAILLRGHTSDVLLSLMLQYLLTLNSLFTYLLFMFGEIEKKMVSV